jgi:hypothetical protein
MPVTTRMRLAGYSRPPDISFGTLGAPTISVTPNSDGTSYVIACSLEPNASETHIQRSLTSDFADIAAEWYVTAPQLDSGLDEQVLYYYRARSVNLEDNSYLPSPWTYADVPADTQGPTKVFGLTVTKASSTDFTLNWDAPADMRQGPGIGASGMSGYRVLADDVQIAVKTSVGGKGLSLALLYADIGAPAQAGTKTRTGFNWALTTFGQGITDVSDQFSFLYGKVSGDCYVSAEIPAFTATNDSAKNGVMLRQSLAVDAPFVHICVFPSVLGKGIGMRFRTLAGGVADAATTLAIVPNGATVYVKIVKVGSAIFGYYSFDGLDWNLAGQTNVSFTGQFLAGNAISSTPSGGQLSCTVNNLAIQNLAQMSHTATGLNGSPVFKVIPVDVAGREGVATSASAPTTIWTKDTPGFSSLLPEAPAGFAANNSFGYLAINGVEPNLYLIDNLAENTNDIRAVPGQPNTFFCSYGAWLQVNGPAVGGFICAGKLPGYAVPLPSSRKANKLFVGNLYAPGNGVHRRASFIDLFGSNNAWIHDNAFADPIAYASQDKSLVDGIALGGFEENSGSDIFLGWSSYVGAFDEQCQIYGVSQRITVRSCLFSNPWNNAGHPDGSAHGFHLILGDDAWYVDVSRSIMQHGRGRSPWYSRSPRASIANCLGYNGGISTGDTYFAWFNQDPTGSWYGTYANPGAGNTIPSLTNYEDTLLLDGPNTPFGQNAIGLGDGHAFPAGSKLFIQRLLQRSNYSPAALLHYYSTAPGDFIANVRQLAAFPTGLSVRQLVDTLDGHMDFIKRLADTVGPTSRNRSGYAASHANHAWNYINGDTSILGAGRVADSPADIAPEPTIATLAAINPFDPNYNGGDPIPSIAQGRNVVNQVTGRTPLSDHIARQHARVARS